MAYSKSERAIPGASIPPSLVRIIVMLSSHAKLITYSLPNSRMTFST
jgi:hypothetical protein